MLLVRQQPRRTNLLTCKRGRRTPKMPASSAQRRFTAIMAPLVRPLTSHPRAFHHAGTHSAMIFTLTSESNQRQRAIRTKSKPLKAITIPRTLVVYRGPRTSRYVHHGYHPDSMCAIHNGIDSPAHLPHTYRPGLSPRHVSRRSRVQGPTTRSYL